MTEAQQRLAQVRASIKAILEKGQRVRRGDRELQRAELASLRMLETQVSKEVANENAALNRARARFVHASGLRHPQVRSGAPYDLVFSDPPYPMPDADVAADLEALVAHGWLVPGALVIVERAAKRTQVTWPDGIVEDRTKRYGETALWYGHATPAP